MALAMAVALDLSGGAAETVKAEETNSPVAKIQSAPEFVIDEDGALTGYNGKEVGW